MLHFGPTQNKFKINYSIRYLRIFGSKLLNKTNGPILLIFINTYIFALIEISIEVEATIATCLPQTNLSTTDQSFNWLKLFLFKETST